MAAGVASSMNYKIFEPVSNSTFSCSDSVSFDLSLARGLDYYTGVGRLEQ